MAGNRANTEAVLIELVEKVLTSPEVESLTQALIARATDALENSPST